MVGLGVRKEEIRVEVEDATYLVIRTELDDGGNGDGGRRSFARKFRGCIRGLAPSSTSPPAAAVAAARPATPSPEQPD
jgi:hypothetical protein